jgi:hypothetical protein
VVARGSLDRSIEAYIYVRVCVCVCVCVYSVCVCIQCVCVCVQYSTVCCFVLFCFVSLYDTRCVHCVCTSDPIYHECKNTNVDIRTFDTTSGGQTHLELELGVIGSGWVCDVCVCVYSVCIQCELCVICVCDV